ncbi:MAG: CBS domain-containing protein [Deltaproteobacteria bacterium]|nr:CBS domain-containing protein [Deltaproteobacteria bacterium]
MAFTVLKNQNSNHDFIIEDLKLKWKVKHLMSSEVLTFHFDDRLNLVDPALDWRKFRHLPVVDDQGHLKGMVCHRDLMNEFASATMSPQKHMKYATLENVPVKDVMVWSVVTVRPNDSLEDAAQKMYQNKYGCLPVVDGDKKLLGILTEADFVKLVYLGEDALSFTDE